jgi:hypothetical protein
MADKRRTGAQQLGRIVDRLADYVREAPAQDIMEDAEREGREPAKTESRVKALFRRAVAEFQSQQLQRTEEAYKRALYDMTFRDVELPSSPQERRNLLGAILSRQPQLGAAITFQNRDFSDLTDEDIKNHLRKLAILGVLGEKHGDEGK